MLFKYEKSKAAEAFARRAWQGGRNAFRNAFCAFFKIQHKYYTWKKKSDILIL